MEDKNSWGILIVLFLLFIVFGGSSGAGVFGGRGNCASNDCGCSVVSNCQVEKQTIINTATTQNLIHAEGEKSRDQASRIFEAQNAEKLFDAKMKISQLENMVYSNDKFNNIDMQLADIRCNCPKTPPFYAQGYVPTGCSIPCSNSCGVA